MMNLNRVGSFPPCSNEILSPEEALLNRERARETRLRTWVCDNCRSFQALDLNTVPTNLRVMNWEWVVKDECHKINTALGNDLGDD